MSSFLIAVRKTWINRVAVSRWVFFSSVLMAVWFVLLHHQFVYRSSGPGTSRSLSRKSWNQTSLEKSAMNLTLCLCMLAFFAKRLSYITPTTQRKLIRSLKRKGQEKRTSRASRLILTRSHFFSCAVLPVRVHASMVCTYKSWTTTTHAESIILIIWSYAKAARVANSAARESRGKGEAWSQTQLSNGTISVLYILTGDQMLAPLRSPQLWRLGRKVNLDAPLSKSSSPLLPPHVWLNLSGRVFNSLDCQVISDFDEALTRSHHEPRRALAKSRAAPKSDKGTSTIHGSVLFKQDYAMRTWRQREKARVPSVFVKHVTCQIDTILFFLILDCFSVRIITPFPIWEDDKMRSLYSDMDLLVVVAGGAFLTFSLVTYCTFFPICDRGWQSMQHVKPGPRRNQILTPRHEMRVCIIPSEVAVARSDWRQEKGKEQSFKSMSYGPAWRWRGVQHDNLLPPSFEPLIPVTQGFSLFNGHYFPLYLLLNRNFVGQLTSLWRVIKLLQDGYRNRPEKLAIHPNYLRVLYCDAWNVFPLRRNRLPASKVLGWVWMSSNLFVCLCTYKLVGLVVLPSASSLASSSCLRYSFE